MSNPNGQTTCYHTQAWKSRHRQFVLSTIIAPVDKTQILRFSHEINTVGIIAKVHFESLLHTGKPMKAPRIQNSRDFG